MSVQTYRDSKTGKMFVLMPMENFLSISTDVAANSVKLNAAIDQIAAPDVKEPIVRMVNQLNTFLGD
ncbi:hypothetical protein KAR91_66755 [Candidatus Pacearchaeota archaeon]|nr:hypothetical protein [Candidatus Pacearchaeota archaeon]